ncbi:MAG: hypothetical protein HWD62_15245 [Cyclobacteriaceae bacterium]|nr:MAG: hypothetical protein HWD62_15245 [Cyclobacteriaceae bacterium]
MNTQKGIAYYRNSPVGDLIIESEGESITRIGFRKEGYGTESITPVIDQCLAELNEYFTKGRKFFRSILAFAELNFKPGFGRNCCIYPMAQPFRTKNLLFV